MLSHLDLSIFENLVGLFFKEENCFLKGHVLSSKSSCYFGRLFHPGKLTENHKKMFLFKKSQKIIEALYRALDKSEYWVIIGDNLCLFCLKTYVVTPHLNHLNEMVQMRGQNIWFR